MPFHAVIIGAGPSGLAAAARLSHFGVRVCLVEAHRRLGGLSSWHHVKGREIATGLHAFTNIPPDGKSGPLGKLLRQLRLKYSDLDMRHQGFSSIRFPSATMRFSNDRSQIREEVARVFPGQIDGFDRFRELVRATDEGEFSDRRSSARDRLTAHISEPLLIDMLLCPVMFYGNPGGVGDGKDGDRDHPDMDWLLFCVVWKCIFESGFGHPAHGMRPLWEKLAARIREEGGEVRMSCRVERILTKHGRATAVRLASGEDIPADIIFSSAGGLETDALLDRFPTDLPKKPVGTISIAEGISLLECPAVDAGMEETIIFYSFEDRLRFKRPNGIVEDANGVVCAPGNYLPSDGGASFLKITQLANYPAWAALQPESYNFAKHETAAGMAAALGKLGITPGESKSDQGKYAVFDDLFTPVTLERFTLHREGALYGSPVKSRHGTTSCENVFLIGADQGFHGIVGAMLSGVAMANLHLLGKQS